MDISDYMHPLFKRGKTKKTDSIMNATIDSLNKPLTDAETRILNSKTNVLLEKAPKEWLDYFGSYLGLHRKDNETDEDYRNRLMSWVLVNKNDANSIRNAIANFLEISADKIFVYEPYEDIFFYNHAKSLWNSFSFRPSTYYNYAVIDIKIDADFPYKEVADIINLFRPAGVIWVITASINSYNSDAPIIDNTLDGSNSMEFVDTEYTGFNTHDSIVITPELNDDLIVTNPFYWNVSDSLWNGGKEYGNSHSAFQDYLVFGEYDTEFIPSNEGFSDLRKFVHNYDKVSNHLMSVKDNKGISFNLNTYDTSNSLSISNSELANDVGVLQSDGTLGIYANTSYSHAFDNGDYVTIDIMSVVESKVTINNNLYAIDTKWKRFTIPLDNHVLTVLPLENTFIKNVSISETLPSTSSDNSFYPYNEIRDKIKGVAGILDIKHTLVALSSRYTTGKSIAEIANSYADKYLSMVLSTDTFGNNSKCALELFDYSCGLWVQYKEFSLSDKVQQLNIKINDVTNYLNENGLLCFRICTLDTDTITTIVVDYVGFSFYDTIYNNPRINWYYNAYRLITKTNFEDNQLGSWIGGTIVTSDNPIGTVYHNYISSNSVLAFNESFNVVPTTTYYLDIWYKATSETTIKLGDTILDTLPSATDWEHISKDIQIPDGLLIGNISLSSSSGEIDVAYISIKIDEGNDL